MNEPRFSIWQWLGLGLAGFVLGLLIVFLLTGCKSPAQRAVEAIASAPTETAKPLAALPEPKTADEWRAQKQAMLDQIDANDRANADLRQQIGAADRRAEQAEQAAQQATARTQAAWGRRIAFLVFAASVLCTILSFTPWGAILPKSAGPTGIAAGIAILVAAQCWVWAFNHVLHLSIAVLCLGGATALYAICKGTLLLRIRQTYSQAMESANNEADEFTAKADSLAAELKAGVHQLGQRLRGKAVKTWADVAKLQEAAQEKTRILRAQPTDSAIR